MSKRKPAAKPAKQDERVLALEDQVAELTEDLKRVQADFVNYKRRAEEDKQRAIRFGRESAVMALLASIDNVERALAHLPERLAKDEWALGVKSVAKQLDDALRGIGVERLASLGQEFDPELHEAVSVDENGKGKKEVVVEELQPGYTMDGEVIRHAIVKVGRK
jgi:molecular chaperone GrpE